nr:hypothetical protein HmN_000179200 [Hymenolepis microstoma]
MRPTALTRVSRQTDGANLMSFGDIRQPRVHDAFWAGDVGAGRWIGGLERRYQLLLPLTPPPPPPPPALV